MALGNRKKATDMILKYVDKILPGGKNKEMYENILSKLSDKEFDAYMKKLESGEEALFLIAPIMNKAKLSLDNNLKIAEALGHNFFEKLWLTDPVTGGTYLTPIPYLVVDLPLRRQAQTLDKKMSVSSGDGNTDIMTGQSTSKGASLSFPELQTLYAQGLDKSIEELIKVRGGDEKAFLSSSKSMIETGSFSLSKLDYSGKVKSTEVLGILLKAMHLNNNI